jgi:uncharacterized protein
MAVQSSLVPIPDEKRIISLDILRGFAVIGIFVVNIQVMGCHFVHRGACKALHTSGLDAAISMMIKLLFINKFLSIFSFLFGLGIAMQVYRQIRKGNYETIFFIRRMAGLFLIGMLHILFFWSGDILHIYAIGGLALLWLMRKSNALLLTAGVLVLVFPFYHQLLGFISSALHTGVVPDISTYSHEQLMKVNLTGSYLAIMKLHVSEYLHNLGGIHTGLIPRAFFMFAIGAWVVKKGVLTDINGFVVAIRRKMIGAFLVSFLFLIAVYFIIQPNMYLLDAPSLIIAKKIATRVISLLYSVSNMVIAMSYIWLLAYALRWAPVQKAFAPLQYIGKMALTNYIMHSVIALCLFSSVGLRMYGTMRPSTGILIVAIVSLAQILMSKVWLTYFLYGPLEWGWRCFSYFKYLPLRKYPHAVGSSQSPENYRVM